MQITLKPPAYQALSFGGTESLLEFRRQFQILHDTSPIRAIRLFLYYLGSRGLDPLAHSMAFSATSGTMYISLLLDGSPENGVGTENVDSLSPKIASNAMALLSQLDPQFLFKFARNLGALTHPDAVLRGLHLVPAMGDYSIVIPWLRTLTEHSDVRIRARATKLLCVLRPNTGLINRYLQSADARIRSSAVEALWNPKVIETFADVLPALRSAAGDPNHRVAANALVGLYRFGETEALFKMIALCSKKQHLFRAAMAWAMGFVDDSRAVPTLRNLTHDQSFTVRKRASFSLSSLAPLPDDEDTDPAAPTWQDGQAIEIVSLSVNEDGVWDNQRTPARDNLKL
jgi:hypothetical protein